ncbi:methyltransferase domain-containing protein [Candidatus Parcubacteria bacterium]|nr:methyltransferase domain-containing protein [Candidatus Parcubacteria bacterium]
MNIKPIIKPILNNFPFLYDWLHIGTGGTMSARYCYSIWLRHLVKARNEGLAEIPRVVAELGPGDSIGVGLAALLTGTSEYYALDIKEYADTKRNLKIFDELVALFIKQEPIPDDKELDFVRPKLDSYDFPNSILPQEYMEKMLNKKRISAIRQQVENSAYENGANIKIKYIVPWDGEDKIKENSVDFLISQAVMEHVASPNHTYEIIYKWLKPGGCLSQDVDFRSHNLTWRWNSHWRLNSFVWQMLIGRKDWVINREPYSRHLDLIKNTGLVLITDQKTRDETGIKKEEVCEDFAYLSDEDLVTSGAYMLARKPIN